MKTVITFVAVLLFSNSFAQSGNKNNEKPPVKILPGNSNTIPYATLYVYRLKNNIGAGSTYVLQRKNAKLEMEDLGTIKNDSKFIVKLYQTGKNTFSIPPGVNSPVVMNVKPGQEYYLKCSVLTGTLSGGAKLEMVAAEQGKADFNSVRYLLIKED